MFHSQGFLLLLLSELNNFRRIYFDRHLFISIEIHEYFWRSLSNATYISNSNVQLRFSKQKISSKYKFLNYILNLRP